MTAGMWVTVGGPLLVLLLFALLAAGWRRVSYVLARMEKVCDAFEGRPAAPGYPQVLGVLETQADHGQRITRLERIVIPAQRQPSEGTG